MKMVQWAWMVCGFAVLAGTTAVHADVRIQCRTFSGEPVLELLFQEAPAFSEETRAAWDEFVTARDRFVPGPIRELAWGSLSNLSGIDYERQKRFLSSAMTGVTFSVDAQGGLLATLRSRSGVLQVQFEQYYQRIGDEIYYGPNEWVEDGGLLFARVWLGESTEPEIDQSKVLCGAHIQGQTFDPLPYRWTAGRP